MQDPRGAARSLIPEGLLLELAGIEPERIVLRARACAGGARCPACGKDAAGLKKDLSAVRTGLTERWSNGPVEGFVHNLKLVKRQGYGRAGFDLLKARVLAD